MADTGYRRPFEVAGQTCIAIIGIGLRGGFTVGVEFPNGTIRRVPGPAIYDTEGLAMMAAMKFAEPILAGAHR